MSRLNAYINRVKSARSQLMDRGVLPHGLLPEPIERSWSRCVKTGQSLDLSLRLSPPTATEFNEIREKNSRLLNQALPEMENLQTQVMGMQSMVILTDNHGTILHAMGDADFVSKAQRVALQPGVSWSEENTGTNAIGTALVEQAPVFVMGAEHYFDQNAFLNCSASPIIDPYGKTIGTLDISSDYRQPHEHTLALVRMSAQMIENRLFGAEFINDVTLHFHLRPEFIGTLWEGIAVFSTEGKLVAANKQGLSLLGLRQISDINPDFETLFESTLVAVIDNAKRHASDPETIRLKGGQLIHFRVEFVRSPVMRSAPSTLPTIEKPSNSTKTNTQDALASLDTGDVQMHKALQSVRKVIGRDIPILIEGETGTGKELLAKAIHAAGPRSHGPFVAINCASIPDGLIEAELFGYEEGAFTGARKQGVAGKVAQADRGTLFLDEIGEMPLHLQGRLLRVLQERVLTPLGSVKSFAVDISVVSATNNKLRELVERGSFREDLFYRLNGLRVTLPALRHRSDLEALVAGILRDETRQNIQVHEKVMALLRHHPWRGNVRQLRNTLRVALAFLDEGHCLLPQHLPEDFMEAFDTHNNPDALITSGTENIAQAEIRLIQNAIRDCSRNMTAASAKLGISRASLYRKVKQMGIDLSK